MNNEINLLPKKNTSLPTGVNKSVNTLRIFSLGLFFLVMIVSASFFLLVAFSPLESLRDREAVLLNEMDTNRSIIAKHELIKDRLTQIKDLMSSRTNYDEVIDEVKAEIPENVVLAGYAVQGEEISFLFESNSLGALESFIVNMEHYLSEREEYSLLSLTKLERLQSEANYKFSLTLTRI